MRTALSLLCLWCAALPLRAEEPPAPTPALTARTADVAALLALQRSGAAATAHRQTLPGDAQSRAWQRYLDSFSRPIPARFINESFTEK